MIPDYKPSKVWLSEGAPLVACFGKAEAEQAAAIIVWVCQTEGDEWSEVMPLQYMGEILTKALKSGAEPKPVVYHWNRNPFFKPDFNLLLTGKYLGLSEVQGHKSFLLLPTFFERLTRYVQR